MKDHFTAWLDRTNSVNGRRYGDDTTISTFDPLNEQGVMPWFFGTSSTSSPSGNTFDYLCRVGSTTPGTDQLNSAYVAWWDAKWLAWYAATYPGHTPNGDFPGRLDTLPCYAYTGAMGPNVAARSTYRNGTFAEGWTARVAAFLSYVEMEFVTALKTHLRTKSSHILYQVGQNAFCSPGALALGDIVDNHLYTNATATNGNPVTDTITSGGGKGVSWVAGTLTVVFSAAPSRSLLVGQTIRVTQTSGGSWTGDVIIATVFTTTTTNDSFTATGVADPITITGTQVSATAMLPILDNNTWQFHAATAGDAAVTRVHYNSAPGPSAETNFDRANGIAGQSGLGGYVNIENNMHSGKPCSCTELGERGIADPIKGIYRTVYTLLDLLNGGSGAYQFAWINSKLQTGAAEHSIPGDGSSLLDSAAMSLMARYISRYPTEDVAQGTLSAYYDNLAKRNTTDTAIVSLNGQSWAWSENAVAGMWQATLNVRTRYALGGVNSPSGNSYSLPSTGWTHPTLNNASTGKWYVWYNMGTISYENSKIVVVCGRLPKNSADMPTTPLSKLAFSTIDGNAWYGRIIWVSLDGTDLGVGRSALFTWCYPREEAQGFRRLAVDAGPINRAEMLDGDYSGIATSDAVTQPGVVLRNGLEVRLTSPRALTVERLVQGQRGAYYAGYSGGSLYLQPRDPLLILS
jgi:hypothetical protein